MQQSSNTIRIPQIKICGLTDVSQAVGCVELGANAIGCVFFPKSPRFVSDRQAREISDALPASVGTVGVFVDESFQTVMRKVTRCRLAAVQLHGREAPGLVEKLISESVRVIKALFIDRPPLLEAASDYAADAYLVEYGKGTLPGGNALAWDWERAKAFSATYPLVLAGGLTPENVATAFRACMPDAVDVSSGVESVPGQKDLGKVENFIKAVSCCRIATATSAGEFKQIF